MLTHAPLTESRTPVRTARRRTGAVVLLLCFALHLSGCYSYAANGGAMPEPNQRVRAHLTSSGQTWLIEHSGRARTNLEGTFIRSEPEHFLLTVWRSDLPGTTQFRTGIDPLRLPSQHVAGFEQRRLSAGRTILAGVLAAGAVGLAIGVMTDAGGGGDGDGDGTVFFKIRH